MFNTYCKAALATLALLAGGSVYAADAVVNLAPAGVAAKAPAAAQTLTIDGTGNSATFTINASNLPEAIKITATPGLEVFPNELPARAKNINVKVTLKSSMPKTEGRVIVRSGDIRAYVDVVGIGTPLEQKSLADNPVYAGEDRKNRFDDFAAGENGYTIEFRGGMRSESSTIDLQAVTPDAATLHALIEADGISLYNGGSKVNIPNPATGAKGGESKFYNNDKQSHTYRFAVTPDRRIFAYRDGLLYAILRADDYGHKADWTIADGEMQENLLKNGDFEGEYGYRASDGQCNQVQGWIVDPIDQYNCSYDVINKEINKEYDQDNHVMKLQRYNWNDGWGAGTVSQIVDVVPGETYSLSFLAQGGMDKKSGTNMSSVRIYEVQNELKNNSVTITNEDGMQPYGFDYTTSADCHQIKVVLHNERFLNGGGWGSSPQATLIDNVVLAGKSRVLDSFVSFDAAKAPDYFTYDLTGAYAPLTPVLAVDNDVVAIHGAGNSVQIPVTIENLVSVDKVKVTAPAGFSVFPEELSAGQSGTVTVTLESTLPATTGVLVLRAGDLRTYVTLKGSADELEQKDIKENPAYAGGNDAAFVHGAAEGFTPGDNGYTVEVRAKMSAQSSNLTVYGVTPADQSFRMSIEPEAINIYNGASKINVPNPLNGEKGGTSKFYNNDGVTHTYRFAVTSDNRIFAYRDGKRYATLRAADYGHKVDWAVADGEISENLLKNGDFEGEYNYRASDSLLNQVQGWIVDPIDQYNCNYDVVPLEINQEQDHNNHAMKLQRYNWNDGWGAGTVSQIVDVVPGETYSLSFLAKGGMDKKSGTNMSSVRIYEVQNELKNNSVTITNETGMQPYGFDYTASADCHQLKVVLHNERFLNGGGWGSSPQATLIDNVVLAGKARSLDQLVGFDNTKCQLEYMAYDVTGAYSPLSVNFGFDGLDSVDANGAAVSVQGDGVAVVNIADGATVEIFDTLGRLVATRSNYAAGAVIALPARGVYIAVVSTAANKQTFRFGY